MPPFIYWCSSSSIFIVHMLSTPWQLRYKANSRCLSFALAGVCESAFFKSLGESVYFLDPTKLPSCKALHCAPWAFCSPSLHVSHCLIPTYLSHLLPSSSPSQAPGWELQSLQGVHTGMVPARLRNGCTPRESPLCRPLPPPLGASTLLSWGCLLGKQKSTVCVELVGSAEEFGFCLILKLMNRWLTLSGSSHFRHLWLVSVPAVSCQSDGV